MRSSAAFRMRLLNMSSLEWIPVSYTSATNNSKIRKRVKELQTRSGGGKVLEKTYRTRMNATPSSPILGCTPKKQADRNASDK
jgi:hypothetical protein